MAVKESKVSVVPMHFIFAQKYLSNRDSRPQMICVNLDKLGFSLSLKVKKCNNFILLKVM